MTGPANDDPFPGDGDNFATAGPWRIATGLAWRDWQMAAIEAEIRAAHANADSFGARRSAAKLRRFLGDRDGTTPTCRSG